MKIIDKTTGKEIAEILTNHGMTLDEAILAAGGKILSTEEEITDNDGCNVIINGAGYDWETLDIVNAD